MDFGVDTSHSFVSCINSSAIGSSNTIYLIVGLFITFLSSFIAFYMSDSRLLHFLSAFLVATFVLKIPLCLFMPAETHLVVLPYDISELGPLVVKSFYLFSFGFLTLVILSCILPFLFPWSEKKYLLGGQLIPCPDASFKILCFACVAMLFLKFLTIFVLGIGDLGEAPRMILFPGFTGGLKFATSTGLIALLTSNLALALTRRKFSSFAIAMMMLLAYLAMDLSIGKKRFMFIIILCLIWLIVFLDDKKLQARLKPLMPVFILVPLLLYGPVMAMRHDLIKGRKDNAEALTDIITGDAHSQSMEMGKVVNKLIRRFNGLDLFIVTNNFLEVHGEPLGPIFLINGKFGPIFAHEIMGVSDEVVIGMGSTMWGFIIAVLGQGYIWFAGLLLAIAIFAGERCCGILGAFPDALAVCQFNVALLMMRFAMGSGMFLFNGKEAIVIAFFMFWIYKFSWGTSAMRSKAKQIAMQMYYGVPVT